MIRSHVFKFPLLPWELRIFPDHKDISLCFSSNTRDKVTAGLLTEWFFHLDFKPRSTRPVCFYLGLIYLSFYTNKPNI